jgi:RES domain
VPCLLQILLSDLDSTRRRLRSPLADIFDLDNATNIRLRAENDLVPGIGVRELLFGVPNSRIVNAAYTHPHSLGSRFNGPDRGAWYAAFEIKTAHAEVAFHKTVQLAEVGRFEDDVTFDDYLADFSGQFHDLRGTKDAIGWLHPDTYVQSQALAERLQDGGSLGIVYPSVRRAGGICLVCFRPALVMHVRKGTTYRFRWNGHPTPTIAVPGFKWGSERVEQAGINDRRTAISLLATSTTITAVVRSKKLC